jgi:hypothetical protein
MGISVTSIATLPPVTGVSPPVPAAPAAPTVPLVDRDADSSSSRTGATVAAVAGASALGGALATTATATAWARQGLQLVGPVVSKGRFVAAVSIRAKNDLPHYVRTRVASERFHLAQRGIEHPNLLQRGGANVKGTLRGVGKLKPLHILRDTLIGATADTVPIRGGAIKLPKRLGGKVLVTNSWAKSLRLSSGIGATLLGVTALAAGLNIASGLEQQGPSGITGTTEGRSGAILGATAALGLGVSGFAAIFRRNPAVIKNGVEIVARQSRHDAFLAADWLQKWQVKAPMYAAGYGLGPLLAYNMLGGLKFMDRKPDAAK